MAYFPDRSKESAGKLLAREIHTNEPLMAELSKTANPERELSTAEINQMKRRTPPNATFAFIQTMGIVRGSAHKSTGLVHTIVPSERQKTCSPMSIIKLINQT